MGAANATFRGGPGGLRRVGIALRMKEMDAEGWIYFPKRINRRMRRKRYFVAYTVHGTPQDLTLVQGMFARDDATKKEFEKWAVSRIDAQAWPTGKKSADGGIDGRLPFGKTNVALVSVEGGKDWQRNHIDQLRAVIDREKADIGVFLTLHEPIAP